MASMMASHFSSQRASLSASTITRSRGSVPLLRSSTRPFSPSSASAVFTAACTAGQAMASSLSVTTTFFSFWG